MVWHLLVDLNHQVDGLAVFLNLSVRLWSHIHVALSPIDQREVLQTRSDFFDTEQFASLKWNEISQDLGRYYERITAIRGLDSDIPAMYRGPSLAVMIAATLITAPLRCIAVSFAAVVALK